MRIFAAILAVTLVLLQYRVWISDRGFREVARLQASVDAQKAANREQSERNRQLGAEVNNLKGGLNALEERARSELGMVGSGRTRWRGYRALGFRSRGMSAPAERRLWAIVPAAGRGERFASGIHGLPKQYTPLLGRSVLEWSLRALLAEPRVHAIVVVLAANDTHWPKIRAKLNSPKLLSTIGGAQRQDSVMNGLEYLASRA